MPWGTPRSAMAYRDGFRYPRLCATTWSARATMPEKSGEASLVPPTIPQPATDGSVVS
jgi:hypothetical protein